MDTDLVNGAVAFQQAKVIGQVQMRVARKILDAQQADGTAALQLLNAATKGVTTSGDQLVAAATGLGGQLDTYA